MFLGWQKAKWTPSPPSKLTAWLEPGDAVLVSLQLIMVISEFWFFFYREVEGSFLTRLWARKELSMGLSSGVGWEFFRAE